MKRIYKKKPLFDLGRLGVVLFALFVLFTAYKILSPPSDELERIDSPDGTKTARLIRYFYYNNQPSYKVEYRDGDKPIWLTLYHLPAYTNVPVESSDASIQWGPDSERLYFLINGTSIWHHSFDPHSDL